MIVCAHGNVIEYCKSRDLIIVDRWDGDFRDYNGKCPILVTDAEITEAEYYFEKGKMLARGIELVSTRYEDNALLVRYMTRTTERNNPAKKRAVFGATPEEVAVIERIRELRREGFTIREIQAADGVRHTDGRYLSLSLIHRILQKG